MLLPEEFIQKIKTIPGIDPDHFLESFNNEPSTSIRLNPVKYSSPINLKSVEYCSTGYFLKKRPVFTIDPFFHSGVYYVQESSSMFLEQVFKQSLPAEPLRILDLCASPGGKSTHIASLISGKSLLVSNDVIRSRAQILSENLKKWGNANVIVTNNDPKDFGRLEGFFDIIVVDAPCSGEGLFRRDEHAVKEWSEEVVNFCSQRQKRILADSMPALKENGILVYCTCTFNTTENEENIRWLKKSHQIESIDINIDKKWGITVSDADGMPCYRFYPHKVPGEGFFLSLFRKKSRQSFGGKIKGSLLNAAKAERESAKKYVLGEENEILRHENYLLAFPGEMINDLHLIKNELNIIHAGVKIGEPVKNAILPSHELSLSNILKRGAFPEADLSIKETLKFLRREEINPHMDEKGWGLITYRGIPSGWVKNLGHRFNNYFPKEWRIRMSLSAFTAEILENEINNFPF